MKVHDEVLAESTKDLASRMRGRQVPKRDEIFLTLLLAAGLIDGDLSEAKISAIRTAKDELGLKIEVSFEQQKLFLEGLGAPINVILFAKQNLSLIDRALLFGKVAQVQAMSGPRSKDAHWYAGLCKDIFELDEAVVDRITRELAERLVDSELSSGTSLEASENAESKGAGCFVATAAFDDPNAPEVRILQDFRDTYLLASGAGTLFVRLYYRLSPRLAAWAGHRPLMLRVIRQTLRAALFAAGATVENKGSQSHRET